MRVALPCVVIFSVEPRACYIAESIDAGFKQRSLDQLPLAYASPSCPLKMEHGRKNATIELLGSKNISDGIPNFLRRAVSLACDMHKAAHRLDCQIERCFVRPFTSLRKACYRGIYEGRVAVFD